MKRIAFARVAVALVGMATITGCQVGHQWFHFDSDTRTPAFGLELMPQASAADREKAVNRAMELPSPTETMEKTLTKREGGWKKWLPDVLRPQRIPLPQSQLLAADRAQSGDARSVTLDDF